MAEPLYKRLPRAAISQLLSDYLQLEPTSTPTLLNTTAEPLYKAASGGGHLTVVERLLTAGADVNADTGRRDGRTALQAAFEGGHLAVAERLQRELKRLTS
ncbi:hypothetical protein MFIFM68171_02545 [Madurella fahalii]|uniref:Uncharacterized protein n=1 Tax=Madurella fahalii TaxID=1157608 RepID=A0ABQ0G3I8_9PEZI